MILSVARYITRCISQQFHERLHLPSKSINIAFNKNECTVLDIYNVPPVKTVVNLIGETLKRLLVERGSITKLNLAANRLGDGGARAVADCLPYCTQLKHLDLRNNGIGESGLIALAGALHLCIRIESFLIWGNTFGPVSCRSLMDLLERLRTDCRPFIVDFKVYEVDGEIKVAHLDV